MLQQTHSQDSNFKKVWEEMEKIEPLTPISHEKEVNDCLRSYREAAECDEYLFGDYNFCEEWLSDT